MAHPFRRGLVWVFGIAMALSLSGPSASALRGRDRPRAPARLARGVPA